MRKLLLGLAALLLAPAAFATDDLQMWNGYSFKLPVYKDKVKFFSKFETRFRDDVSEFFRYHFYMGPQWNALKNLTLQATYGNIQEQSGGHWHTEHRMMLYAIPKCKLSDFGLKEWGLGDFRLQVENRLDWRYRGFAAHTHTWRYRLHPKIAYPLFKFENLTVSPYASSAFYFDFTDNIDFNQHRIYGGLAFKFYSKFTLSCYYLWLNKRSGTGWQGSSVIGTNVGYDF